MASIQYIHEFNAHPFCPDWISTKERKPKDSGCYIIACQMDDRTIVGTAMFYYGHFDTSGVTHWMPLPLPPKQEEGENNG